MWRLLVGNKRDLIPKLDPIMDGIMKSKKLIGLKIFLCLLIAIPAQATLIMNSPSSVCSVLDDQGLSAGGWENIYDDEFGCHSRYKEIGSGYPLANNLAFYVDGGRDVVTEAKLVLNVNNSAQARSAHLALLHAGIALSKKIAGGGLPRAIKEGISKGKSTERNVGGTSVEVVRKDWPTGKGYELHVIFK